MVKKQYKDLEKEAKIWASSSLLLARSQATAVTKPRLSPNDPYMTSVIIFDVVPKDMFLIYGHTLLRYKKDVDMVLLFMM